MWGASRVRLRQPRAGGAELRCSAGASSSPPETAGPDPAWTKSRPLRALRFPLHPLDLNLRGQSCTFKKAVFLHCRSTCKE